MFGKSSSNTLTDPSIFPSSHFFSSSLCLHNLSSRLFVSIPRFCPVTPPPSCIFITYSFYTAFHLLHIFFYPPFLPCTSIFQLPSSHFTLFLGISLHLDMQSMSKRFQRMFPPYPLSGCSGGVCVFFCLMPFTLFFSVCVFTGMLLCMCLQV